MGPHPAHALRSLTVGPAGADVVGYTGASIQLAIDAIACRGGGTVVVRSGTYELLDAVRLRPDVALVGEGRVLFRRPERLAWSPLVADADCGQCEITPADPSAFRPGMGLALYDEDRSWAFHLRPLKVRAIEAGRLLLEEMIADLDRAAERSGRVVSHYPLVLVRQADRARVENLELDGAVADDGPLEELWSAGLYVYHSAGVAVRGVRVHAIHGDGICVAEGSVDAVVEECETFGNTHHGIHPGSHSARARVRRCHIHHNGSDGLYVCWGVAGGIFEENDIHHNGSRLWRSGLSIGHKDTDCLVRRNHIRENCKYGICVRQKSEANGAHRGTYEANAIENNGQDPAGMPAFCRRFSARELTSVGISVLGVTHDLVFRGNAIRETRPVGQQYQRHGVYLGPGVRRVTFEGNAFSGHPDQDVVDESGASDHHLP